MGTDPELYRRDCRECWKYQFFEEGPNKGQPRVHRDKPLERPPGVGPPCTTPQGCKKGTIDEQNVLTETNARIVNHYRQCRATFSFPPDDAVRHNAGIIHEVERMLDRVESKNMANVVEAIAARGVL